MASTYAINVSGKSPPTVIIPPVPGVDGPPLGTAGNGADGESSGLFGWTCKKPAGPGLPGNGGLGAPPAQGGANGGNACSVTITIADYSGDPLMILNNGGNGANGNDGGVGGKGSDGGKAGRQPSACKTIVPGGIGGNAGNGGDAGAGGAAGNAADIVVTMGKSFGQPPVGADSSGGTAGLFGQPGVAGAPGNGGTGSDGTIASGGTPASNGHQPPGGNGGYGGSFVANIDPSQAPTYVKISVQAYQAP